MLQTIRLIGVMVFLFNIQVNKGKICRINGAIDNIKDSTMLYLTDFDTRELIDSILVVNGKFKYELPLTHPQKFVLHNKKNQDQFLDMKFIWLEPSDLTINGNFKVMNKLTIGGSETHDLFVNYNQILKKVNPIDEIQAQILYDSKDEKRNDSIKLCQLKKELSNTIVDFLIKNKHSYFSLSALYTECFYPNRHLNKTEINLVYSNFSNELKNSGKGISIKKFTELPEPPQVGDKALEINQFTPEGKTVKLSDFKGKYVLLDFWSSSCGPCRLEHKWLRKIYSEYHPKGFEIFEVSCDTNKEKWMKAIEKDSIPWINVSDLKGIDNEAFILYDIKLIPQNFLINPEGKIIKRNLSSALNDQILLKNIFENKKR
jgi:peroxiredoxin